MSYEPGRKVAYSVDLRHRMIWQRFSMEEQFRSIAKNLGVSVGTVYNICKVFEQTGCVDARKPDRLNTRVLSLHNYNEQIIIRLLFENPSLYLGEIENISSLKVSTSHSLPYHPEIWVYTENGTASSSAEV